MTYTISELVGQQDLILNETALLMTESIGSSAPTYGLTSTIATALTSASAGFDTAMSALDAAEKAYKAAVQDKKVAREALVSKLQTYLPMCYANPSVTDGTLATISLAPRPERRAFVAPTVPLNFTAVAQSNGYVTFKWKRNGNTIATTFVLEQQQTNGTWEQIWSGSKTKVLLDEFTPGVEAFFRVYASKGEDQSQPSEVQVIYPTGGTGEISVAA